MKRWLTPAVVLFFLAPAIGELLSSSAPPVEFFHPVTLLILTILYGGGALLIREYSLRWGKGWYARCWLATAYGIVEEGLMVGSWFNPKWPDIQDLGQYGWFLGTNWVWATNLTFYHATVSTLIPILLVELLFPKRRNELWLSDRALLILTGVFSAEVFVGAFVIWGMFKYSYPIILPFFTLLPILFLVHRARLVPNAHAIPPVSERKVPAFFVFTLLGFLSIFLMFFLSSAFSKGASAVPFVVPIVLFVVFVGLVGRWMEVVTGYGQKWTDLHRLAIATGPLLFFIAVAPLREFVLPHPDNPAGMSVVGIAAALFLFYLYSKISRRMRQNPEREPQLHAIE